MYATKATTLRLPPALLTELRRSAVRNHRTISAELTHMLEPLLPLSPGAKEAVL